MNYEVHSKHHCVCTCSSWFMRDKSNSQKHLKDRHNWERALTTNLQNILGAYVFVAFFSRVDTLTHDN